MTQEERLSRDNLKFYLEIIGASIALVTLVFGASQYYSAQKWKESELASKQVEKLHSDKLISETIGVR